MRRILTPAVLALAVALAGAVAGVEAAAPAKAATPSRVVGPSVVDGPITRAEILERARVWVDDRAYRRDCAGFVDMAWHLGTDHWTGTLARVSTPIGRSELAAGDILLDAEEHVILFNGWEPDRVHFSYYVFGAAFTRRASIDQEMFEGRPNGAYQARRYKKVVEVEKHPAPVESEPGPEPSGTRPATTPNPLVVVPASPSGSTPPSGSVSPSGSPSGDQQ
jgi:hypothetical protein